MYWGFRECGGGLDNSPLEDVIPDLDQVHLLGRGLSSQRLQRGGFGCVGAFLHTFGCLSCKGLLGPFELNIARVVRSVVVTAAIAIKLLPRGRTPTGICDPLTRRTWKRIRSYAA